MNCIDQPPAIQWDILYRYRCVAAFKHAPMGYFGLDRRHGEPVLTWRRFAIKWCGLLDYLGKVWWAPTLTWLLEKWLILIFPADFTLSVCWRMSYCFSTPAIWHWFDSGKCLQPTISFDFQTGFLFAHWRESRVKVNKNLVLLSTIWNI